jgi:hypothetical protein
MVAISEAGIEANVSAGDTTRQNITATPTATSLKQRAQYLSNKMAAAFTAGVAGYILWDKIMASSSSAWNIENDQALGYGSYGTGPPQGAGTQDPSLCVFKDFTTLGSWTVGSSPPSAANACSNWPVPVPGPVDHYAFVDGTTEGWGINAGGWGDLGVAYSSSYNHSGSSGSLKVTIAGNPNLDTSNGIQVAPGSPDFNPYSEIEVESASAALLTPGSVVTMYVYNATSGCSNLGVKPVLRLSDANASPSNPSDLGWVDDSGTEVYPSTGGWTELTITVPTDIPGVSPADPVAIVNAVGLEVDVPQVSNGVWETACEGQSVYLDDVSW